MPNSLRSKLSKLRHKGQITDDEYKELIDKLEGHDADLFKRAYDLGYEEGFDMGNRKEEMLKDDKGNTNKISNQNIS